MTFNRTDREQCCIDLPFLPLPRVLSRDGDPHVEFLEDGQVLKVKSVRLRDQGLYQCLASNNAGTQMRQFRLRVQGLYFSADFHVHVCLHISLTLLIPRCMWYTCPSYCTCHLFFKESSLQKSPVSSESLPSVLWASTKLTGSSVM